MPGNAYTVTTRACAPNAPANADVIAATTVGGTRAGDAVAHARRAGDASAPFTPGVAQELHGVDDRERDLDRRRRGADGRRPEPNATGHLVNGSLRACRSRCRALEVVVERRYDAARSPTTRVTITFTQAIGANEPLRTGAYAKTLTFTLSTTNP